MRKLFLVALVCLLMISLVAAAEPKQFRTIELFADDNYGPDPEDHDIYQACTGYIGKPNLKGVQCESEDGDCGVPGEFPRTKSLAGWSSGKGCLVVISEDNDLAPNECAFTGANNEEIIDKDKHATISTGKIIKDTSLAGAPLNLLQHRWKTPASLGGSLICFDDMWRLCNKNAQGAKVSKDTTEYMCDQGKWVKGKKAPAPNQNIPGKACDSSIKDPKFDESHWTCTSVQQICECKNEFGCYYGGKLHDKPFIVQEVAGKQDLKESSRCLGKKVPSDASMKIPFAGIDIFYKLSDAKVERWDTTTASWEISKRNGKVDTIESIKNVWTENLNCEKYNIAYYDSKYKNLIPPQEENPKDRSTCSDNKGDKSTILSEGEKIDSVWSFFAGSLQLERKDQIYDPSLNKWVFKDGILAPGGISSPAPTSTSTPPVATPPPSSASPATSVNYYSTSNFVSSDWDCRLEKGGCECTNPSDGCYYGGSKIYYAVPGVYDVKQLKQASDKIDARKKSAAPLPASATRTTQAAKLIPHAISLHKQGKTKEAGIEIKLAQGLTSSGSGSSFVGAAIQTHNSKGDSIDKLADKVAVAIETGDEAYLKEIEAETIELSNMMDGVLQHYENADYEKAQQELDKLQSKDPDNPLLNQVSPLVSSALKNIASSVIEYFTPPISVTDFLDAVSYAEQAIEQYKQGDVENAKKTIAKAENKNPENPHIKGIKNKMDQGSSVQTLDGERSKLEQSTQPIQKAKTAQENNDLSGAKKIVDNALSKDPSNPMLQDYSQSLQDDQENKPKKEDHSWNTMIGPNIACSGDESLPSSTYQTRIQQDAWQSGGKTLLDAAVAAGAQKNVHPALLAIHMKYETGMAKQQKQVCSGPDGDARSSLTGCGWPPKCAKDCSCSGKNTQSDEGQLVCTAGTDADAYLKATGQIKGNSIYKKRCSQFIDNEEKLWMCILCTYQGNYLKDLSKTGDKPYFVKDGYCNYGKKNINDFCSWKKYIEQNVDSPNTAPKFDNTPLPPPPKPQPISKARFKFGDLVQTVSKLNLRSSPGVVDSHIIQTADKGEIGRIVSPNPIIKDNFRWYEIQYTKSNNKGWSAENWLTGSDTPSEKNVITDKENKASKSPTKIVTQYGGTLRVDSTKTGKSHNLIQKADWKKYVNNVKAPKGIEGPKGGETFGKYDPKTVTVDSPNYNGHKPSQTWSITIDPTYTCSEEKCVNLIGYSSKGKIRKTGITLHHTGDRKRAGSSEYQSMLLQKKTVHYWMGRDGRWYQRAPELAANAHSSSDPKDELIPDEHWDWNTVGIETMNNGGGKQSRCPSGVTCVTADDLWGSFSNYQPKSDFQTIKKASLKDFSSTQKTIRRSKRITWEKYVYEEYTDEQIKSLIRLVSEIVIRQNIDIEMDIIRHTDNTQRRSGSDHQDPSISFDFMGFKRAVCQAVSQYNNKDDSHCSDMKYVCRHCGDHDANSDPPRVVNNDPVPKDEPKKPTPTPEPSPPKKSVTKGKFKVGDIVQTSVNLKVRRDPSLKSEVIKKVSAGERGSILSGPYVDKEEKYTWYSIVWSDGKQGYSAENWLDKYDPQVFEERVGEINGCTYTKAYENTISKGHVLKGSLFNGIKSHTTNFVNAPNNRYSRKLGKMAKVEYGTAELIQLLELTSCMTNSRYGVKVLVRDRSLPEGGPTYRTPGHAKSISDSRWYGMHKKDCSLEGKKDANEGLAIGSRYCFAAHTTHLTGRDADIGLFIKRKGKLKNLLVNDACGRSTCKSTPRDSFTDPEVLEANWFLLKTMADLYDFQYIAFDKYLIKELHEYACQKEPNNPHIQTYFRGCNNIADKITSKSYVKKYGWKGKLRHVGGHANHYHIAIACSLDDLGSGCSGTKAKRVVSFDTVDPNRAFT